MSQTEVRGQRSEIRGQTSDCSLPAVAGLPTSELPLLRSTEQAEAYGRGLRRVIGPDEFQTLVRTWIITDLAARETHDAGAKILLATKCQLLREAVQAFLFPDGSVSREEVSIEAFMEVAQS